MSFASNIGNIYVGVVIIFIAACEHTLDGAEKQAIWNNMRSGNRDNIIQAISEIKASKDTSMVKALFYQIDDPRITHLLKYKGKSIYQLKIEAIADITGIDPPKNITYDVDTSVIKYYRNAFTISDSSSYTR